MRAVHRKSFRKIATVFIVLSATLGSSSHAEAGLLGPSSDYIVRITPATQVAVESAIKNAGGTVNQRFQYAMNGFVIKLPDILIPVLKKIPNVLTVEKDAPVSGLDIQQNETPTPSWGLDRIDQREPIPATTGYQGNYGYRSAGAGSTIYIGDTGIYPSSDLVGRISTVGFSGIADGNGTTDCNGHGTHVATTTAGTKYGVAKKANVVPVRILDCTGRGSYATVIAGLDWILSPLNTNPKTQAVLNLSIGGGKSDALNDAVLKLTNAGITVVVAAGNDNADACSYSPASAPSAITVGAVTIGDAKASFSNWGTCVDINAPGVGITAGWIGNADATNTISGTSMATPHVTGAAAVYLGLNPGASPAQVADGILAQSTANALTGLNATTPNKMLYVSPTDGGPVIVPPAVLVQSVSTVTHESAAVSVEINPNNAPTTGKFEYSTDQTFATGVKTINLTPSAALVGGDVIAIPLNLDSLTASSTYYFRATASNESGVFTTPIGMFRTVAPPVKAPTVLATAPTLVTGYSAHLNGTVNANNGTTNVFFVWGTDPTFATNSLTIAPPQATVSGNQITSIGLDISFLNGSTTYYYKVVAGNSVAETTSNTYTFTTPAIVGVAPTVETIRPTGGLNYPSTTVTGRVNPQGQTTTIRFIYGPEASLTVGTRIVDIATKYTGIDTVTVTADMVNLTPGYRYYYRFEASNAAGITKMAPLTNSVNPIAPVINSTTASLITTTTMQLNANVNAGAGNLRFYFIYGTDPKLETGTVTISATPFAIANGINTPILAAISSLNPGTSYYFRVKMFAYSGPLVDVGGYGYGPIVKVDTLFPPRATQVITFNLPTTRFYGGAPTPLTATSNTGLPITYTTSSTNQCKIDTVDGQPVLTYATPIYPATSMTCSVFANQAGDYFNLPISVARSITWVKESTIATATYAAPLSETSTAVDFAITSTSQPSLNENLVGSAPLVVTSKTPTVCVVDSVTGTRAMVHSLWNGTCQLVVAFAGNSYWLPSSTIITTTVAGMTRPQPGANAPQAITFTMPTSRYYGGPATPLTASASSGLPVTYTTSTPAICQIISSDTGTVLTHVLPLVATSATCAVTASQPGNGAYAPATSVMRLMSFMKEATTITGSWAGLLNETGTAFDLNVVSLSQPALKEAMAGNAALTVTSSTKNICVVDSTSYIGSPTVHTRVIVRGLWNGTCSLQVSFAGNSYWLASSLVASKAITGMTTPQKGATAAQSIVYATPAATQLGLLNPINARATSGLPITVTSTTPATCSVVTLSNGTFAASSADGLTGDNNLCTVRIEQSGSDSWAPATPISISFKWLRKAQTLTFTLPASRYYGGAATVLAPTSTSGLPVTVTSISPAVCTVTTTSDSKTVLSYVSPLPAPSANYCYLTASQSGDGTYAPATPVGRTIALLKESTAIQTTLTAPINVAGSALDIRVVSAVQASLGELNGGTAPLTVRTLTPKVCTVANPTYVGTSASHTRVTVSALWNGTCQLSVAFAGNTYWLPVTSTYSVSVSGVPYPQAGAGAAQMINSFATIANREYGPAAPLAATATSGLPVVFTSTTPATCQILEPTPGKFFVQSAPGVSGNGVVCSVQASQPGSDAWAAAAPVVRSFTWNKAAIIIRVTNGVSTRTGAGPFQLIASAANVTTALNSGLQSLGLPVTVSTSTPAICQVVSSGPLDTATGIFTQASVKGLANGVCSLTYNFAGSDTRAAATTVYSFGFTGIK